jgi:outer membrane protein OmpA-like peptidoglycan-associated protein
VINIPLALAPRCFWFDHSGNYIYSGVSNVRLAQGAVPLYDRLASDGKIVTYAITFDTGKASIRPESTGEINRITKIMTDDPSINFEIQGHCDNTGSDAVNDPLSQKRAEAILAALVANGIDASLLTAVGKGAHEPIADNATDEGRAKNRRVEFVKK